MAQTNNKRPVFLNLFQIRLPVSGVISILHRITGVLLFLCIPISLWILTTSLASEQQFSLLIEAFHQPVNLVLIAFILWALLHHLLAGIRHLLLDFDIGADKEISIKSSWIVMLAAPIMTALLMLRFFL
jgi:succinate dehydrogenase / fumarate reductase cytochrome b subunit